nr:hypothetical protein L204_04209 [Cryptococcus depauperatus CBS 7855]
MDVSYLADEVLDKYNEEDEMIKTRLRNALEYFKGDKEGYQVEIGMLQRLGTMANASSKRIASSNEAALNNLRLGLIVVNILTPAIRFLFSLITSRSFIPKTIPLILYIVSLATTIFIYRWFVSVGAPKLSAGAQVKVADDLKGKGVIEFGWDVIYMAWICAIGSSLLGDWFWWLIALIPAFGIYKLYSVVRPLLAVFLPGIFGHKAPSGPSETVQEPQEKTESRKQAKLRARMEKGDKRVQQVQRR